MHLGIFQNIQWPEETDQRQQFGNAIEQTLIAEQLGFESAYFVEHHFTRHGILSSTLAVLSYLAGRTSRLRLGTAVLVLPFHDPVRLVEEAATVDLLSGGRLELGVGRGFQWTEFNGFGLSLDDSSARYDEALEIILKAWREPERFSYEGRFWRYANISVEPKPLQAPHPPVWAAAGSPESATKVGRLGLRMQLSSGVSLRRIPELIAAYRVGLAESGYAFDSEHVLVSRITHVAETRQKAWETAQPHFEWFRRMVAAVTPAPGQSNGRRNSNPLLPQLDGPIGSGEGDPGFFFCTPDEAIQCLEDLSAMGVGHVIFQGNWGGMPQEDVVRSLRLIGQEVLPNFAATVSK
ncbi:MAG TPA: LLM class flavin-dependent oxidoreductase [Dehalococcoidia bacterium]|nr:LLM class flavin-dependent oxidoreductase [Dehalococcoidia bacterium]